MAHVKLKHIKDVDDFFDQIDQSVITMAIEYQRARNYTDINYVENETLIFGSETEGLFEDIRNRYSEQCITIPMMNTNIRSINLANAVSIVLYEAIRQRQ